MKPKQILRLCLLVAAMAVLSLFQGAPAVRADDLNPSYSVALWDTKYFQGDGGEWFWGTEFFYQVTNEQNPSYDWPFVGLKYHRQNPIGVLAYLDANMYVDDYNGGTVWEVDAQPWHKEPFSGDLDLSVGTGGASVSAHIESNGYDQMSWTHGGTYVGDYWAHDLTRADSDWWGTKSGAMVVKVQEVNGYMTNIYGSSGINYAWFGWDWGCWCDLWRYRSASFPDGYSVLFGDSTPGG